MHFCFNKTKHQVIVNSISVLHLIPFNTRVHTIFTIFGVFGTGEGGTFDTGASTCKKGPAFRQPVNSKPSYSSG